MVLLLENGGDEQNHLLHHIRKSRLESCLHAHKQLTLLLLFQMSAFG